ncbi:hypothetical protein HAX54_029184, partial [Datura stramonium]|nr:hypothetical protein [Datura stramonium]
MGRVSQDFKMKYVPSSALYLQPSVGTGVSLIQPQFTGLSRRQTGGLRIVISVSKPYLRDTSVLPVPNRGEAALSQLGADEL